MPDQAPDQIRMQQQRQQEMNRENENRRMQQQRENERQQEMNRWLKFDLAFKSRTGIKNPLVGRPILFAISLLHSSSNPA